MDEKVTGIVFVCHGNICRSPMAEFVFRQLAKERGREDDFRVSSAAVSFEEEGNGLYPYAADTLRRHNVPFGRHRAHRITRQEYDDADIVVVMDSSNLRLIERITGNTDKVHRLLEYAGQTADVADPWYTGNFEQAYSDILRGCRSLLDSLTVKPMASEKIQRTLEWLEAHEISYEIHYHPPLFTIEEALAYWKDIDSTHCKNLFMRNHKGNRHYLISFECHKDLDIHSLEHMLHQGKLSFASPERMDRCLGVSPGSVCAFGLINDIGIADTADPKELFENGHRVKYFLDSDLRNADRISFHPCDNTASVVLSNGMFMKFLSLWGGEYEWLDIPGGC